MKFFFKKMYCISSERHEKTCKTLNSCMCILRYVCTREEVGIQFLSLSGIGDYGNW